VNVCLHLSNNGYNFFFLANQFSCFNQNINTDSNSLSFTNTNTEEECALKLEVVCFKVMSSVF